MFLTGSTREDICLPNSNKLHWKWIREIKHDQIPRAMMEYAMYGETKGREILPYQALVYCEKIIEGLNQEEVEQYHVGLGKLFKWLNTAIAGRKLDITRRKIATRRAKEDRQGKIEKEEDRKQRREDYLLDTKAQWEQDKAEDIEVYDRWADRERRREAGEPVSEDEDEDAEGEDDKEKVAPVKPVFDEFDTLAKFDEKEENAVVEIPDEIVNDTDDDWPMTAEEEQEYIDRVLDQRAVV